MEIKCTPNKLQDMAAILKTESANLSQTIKNITSVFDTLETLFDVESNIHTIHIQYNEHLSYTNRYADFIEDAVKILEFIANDIEAPEECSFPPSLK